MIFNSPISEEKVGRLIKLVDLESSQQAIDIGCGNGEFLIRLHQATGVECLGIDMGQVNVEDATLRLRNLKLGEKVKIECADIKGTAINKEHFQLAICMGSSHAFADGRAAYSTALCEMSDMLQPNGMILIGEGYWKRPPDQEYLDFLGDPAGVYNSYEENIVEAETLGLTPIYASESTTEEWDEFEWGYRRKFEREVIGKPEDHPAHEKLGQVREWNRYYQHYGRTTMGYAHYVFIKPGSA